MHQFHPNLALWFVIILMMVMLYNAFNTRSMTDSSVSYTEFLAMVNEEQVKEVVIQGQELLVTDLNQNRFKIYSPQDPDLINQNYELAKHNDYLIMQNEIFINNQNKIILILIFILISIVEGREERNNLNVSLIMRRKSTE